VEVLIYSGIFLPHLKKGIVLLEPRDNGCGTGA